MAIILNQRQLETTLLDIDNVALSTCMEITIFILKIPLYYITFTMCNEIDLKSLNLVYLLLLEVYECSLFTLVQ